MLDELFTCVGTLATRELANDVLLLHRQSAAKSKIWSFVRERIGVPAYQIWWLYTALQLLYKRSPKIDCIVQNLQFSNAIFVSL